jgi:hypothetical protein
MLYLWKNKIILWIYTSLIKIRFTVLKEVNNYHIYTYMYLHIKKYIYIYNTDIGSRRKTFQLPI